MKNEIVPTIGEFRASKRVLSLPADISKWFKDHDIDGAGLQDILSLAYYIQQDSAASYSMIIENTNPSGTLAEMEYKLYRWAF
jgi:hypothetical protein